MTSDLHELREEDPKAFLELVFTRINERSDGMFDVDAFVAAAVALARDEGINLYRVLNEHPAYVESLTGERLSFDQSTVERIDDLVDSAEVGRMGANGGEEP
ncbi:MAG: hypothetical protein R3324_06605 [Halobacteriales archaeon]|nr:hypothetical protein [Halobacteriales archaeon]